MTKMTAAEYQEYHKKGTHLFKTPEPEKENKYKAKPKEYDGNVYQSTKEADQAAKYDLSKHAKNASERVVKVERQLTFDLAVNGIHICKYILDFRVTYADGRVVCSDVKGMKKGAAYNMFKVKKHLMKAIYGIEVIEI